MGYERYVDPFHGHEEVCLPPAKGIARAWRPIKCMAGNTTPAAVLPFGKYSVCAYSGGYSSGYGDHQKSTKGPVPRLDPPGRFFGFSHLHHSGTGAIRIYYNYAIVTPYLSEFPCEGDFLAEETATPGYYACRAKNSGILCEATVSPRAAWHRYTYPAANGKIMVNFMNDGLNRGNPALYSRPQQAWVKIEDRQTVVACAHLQGLAVYFAVNCPQASEACLVLDGQTLADSAFSITAPVPDGGCVFSLHGQVAQLRVGISLISAEAALADARAEGSFDVVRQTAAEEWSRRLAAIDIEADEEEKSLFYTCFYHSLIKPCAWHGESPFFPEKEFMVDVATMWDLYKTHLPLMFSLYPDVSADFVASCLHMGKHLGYFPHMVLLSQMTRHEDRQGRLFTEHSLMDAYLRGVQADWQDVLRVACRDIENAAKQPLTSATHVLDMQEGILCVMDLAEALHAPGIARHIMQYLPKTDVYEKETGLLTRDSVYYEGGRWNYSFRLMHDMTARMARCGGPEGYARLLDQFFGFAPMAEDGQVFEGYNNEPDMETPYGYLFAGRYDRLCTVLKAARTRFCLGKGGLPGNDDSGGLSSCYLWNSLGIFPVAGQDLMLAGLPQFRRATLHLGNGRDFVIQKRRANADTAEIALNGQGVADMRFSVSEMMRGGEITITCP